MPCTTYSDGEMYEMAHADFKRTEALLCLAMRTIGHSVFAELPHAQVEENEKRCGVTYAELKQWWDRHKIIDSARESRERQEQEQRLLRAKALAKLSPAERRALKVRE